MKTLINFVITILFFVAVTLFAFDVVVPTLLVGQVEATQSGTAIYLIQQLQRGAQGFEMWQSNGSFVVSGPVGSGWSFVTLCAGQSRAAIADTLLVNGGNIVTVETFSKFSTWMSENGWTKVPAKNIVDILKGTNILGGVSLAQVVRRYIRPRYGRRDHIKESL